MPNYNMKKEKNSLLSKKTNRAQFSKGKIVDMAATFLKKQVDNETGKATKAAKEKMVSQSQIDELIEEEFMNNPFNPFEDLDEDEFSLIVDAASPKKRSMLLGDEVGAEGMGEMDEMMAQMSPEEVAQNLAFFGDVDEIVNYAQSLNAGQTRKFIEAIPEEDYELFGGFENIVKELGPRELKNKGGSMSALLVPVEMEMEMEQNSKVKPDEEMEEDYVDYVLHETLTEEEYEILDKKLSKDDDLSIMFDKVILAATEFSGAGEVEGPGTGTSDDIPARLSDGEFVFTKKAVDEIGADKLQTMMEEAEKAFDERQGKAEGGMMKQKPDAVDMYDEDDDEDIYNSMLSANRMPSLR